MALARDLRGAGGTAQATSWGRKASEMSKALTPPLKKVPTTTVSETPVPGAGRFSWRLWAPKRPPRFVNALSGGSGQVLIGTGLVSSRTSTIQTSLGQSLPPSAIDSSLTASRPRSKGGRTGWQKPGYGGRLLQGLDSRRGPRAESVLDEGPPLALGQDSRAGPGRGGVVLWARVGR